MDLPTLLRKSPCFAPLDEATLNKIAAMTHLNEYPVGCSIFRTGDTHRVLYLVVEGFVAIQADGPVGTQTTLITVSPGEIFGWSAFVPPHSKTAAAVAMEPVWALAIDAEKLRALCERDTAVGYHVCDTLNRTIAERFYAARLQQSANQGNDMSDWVVAFP